MRRWVALIGILSLLSGVVACGDDGATASSVASAGDAWWDEDFPDVEPVIPESTKVIEETGVELAVFTDDGTMELTGSPGQLADLGVGDVVVSGITEAAPFGALRKVESVTADGDTLVLETSPASLQEAITEGSGGITTELRPEDVISTEYLADGVEFLGPTASGVSMPGWLTYGVNLNRLTGVPIPFDHTWCTDPQGQREDADGTITRYCTGDEEKGIAIDGTIRIKPILNFDIWLSAEGLEWPDLNIKVKAGLERWLELDADAWGQYETHTPEIALVRQTFGPYTFNIGPVPVVLVPVLTIYLRADGTLTAKIHYDLDAWDKLVAGWKYNSDDGFKNLSDHDYEIEQNLWFDGRAQLGAVLGGDLSVLVYGAAGPFVRVEGGPRFTADLEGVGPDGDLWRVEACLTLKAGLEVNQYIQDKLKLKTDRLEWTPYEGCAEWFDEPNTRPRVEAVAMQRDGESVTPVGGSLQLDAEFVDADRLVFEYQGIGEPLEVAFAPGTYMVPITLHVDPLVSDRFGQVLHCEWSSTESTDLLPGSRNEQIQWIDDWAWPIGTGEETCGAGQIVFRQPGTRTLTLAVTDGAEKQPEGGPGKAWSTYEHSFEVMVFGPEDVRTVIAAPSNGAVLPRGEVIALAGEVLNFVPGLILDPTDPKNSGTETMETRWVLEYPTDEDGNHIGALPTLPGVTPNTDTGGMFPGSTQIHQLGEGAVLQWDPGSTPALTLSDPAVGPCPEASTFGVLRFEGSVPTNPDLIVWPDEVVIGFENPMHDERLCEGHGGVFGPPETTTTTLPGTPISQEGATEILEPSPGSVVERDEVVRLSGTSSGGKPLGPLTWSLRYPTDADGNYLGVASVGDGTFVIGEGSDLRWVPENTPGLVFRDPFATVCTEANEFGVLVLSQSSGPGGPITPREIVIGFANPRYAGGLICGGPMQPTTTTSTTTIPVPVTTRPRP